MSAKRITAKQRELAEKHIADNPRLDLSPQELDNLTRAIGSDLSGFDFEMHESYYGSPGRITVMGELVQNGRKYEVTLSMVAGYRLTKDMY